MRVLIVRRAWLVAVLLIAALAIASVFAVPELRLALAGAAGAIVIDPGHGGVDPGAYIAGKVREKDVNLDLALRLESLLNNGPRPVSLTRRTDIALSTRGRSGETRYRLDLNARLAVARRSGAGLMVSVHANYCRDPRPRGPIVFYKPGSAASLQLAKCLLQRLTPFGPQQPQPVAGDFYILREASAPSVLIETGFLSNEQDRALLLSAEHQARLANAIAAGIQDYLTMVARGEGEAPERTNDAPAIADGAIPVYFPQRGEFLLTAVTADAVSLPVTAPGSSGAASGVELLARAVLAQLIAGPADPATHGPGVPAGTTVNGVRFANGTLTVDCSPDLAAIPGTLDEYLTVYGLVNSLCGIPGVEQVQLLIDGQRVESLAGHVSLLDPLQPLYDVTGPSPE